VKVFEPVVAYCPSIKVTLPDIDPEVVANEADAEVKVLEVDSKLVTRVLKLPLVVAYEEDTVLKVAAGANEEEGNPPNVSAYEAEVAFPENDPVIPAEATMLPDITNEPDNCIAILRYSN